MKDDTNRRHHTNYLSNQQVIHKCLLTYEDIFLNMPFSWYVEKVSDSVNRKGFLISREEMVKTIHYFRKDKQDICPYCYDGCLKEKS